MRYGHRLRKQELMRMIRQRVAASLASRRRTSSGVPPPPPPPESANCSSPDAEGGESESFSSDEAEGVGRGGGTSDGGAGKKPWKRVDQSVYEEQLEKLQEQLVQVMIENQALQAELEETRKKPSSSQRRELDQLRQENTSLQQRMRHQAVSTTSSHTSVSSEDDLVEGGYENITTDRERVLKLRSRKRSLPRRFSYSSARESVYNFLSLFSEDVRTPSNEQEEEVTPLTAKRLKENCTRLAKSSKPWRVMATHVKETLRWKSSAESLVVFLIYMYCVWNGWIIQLVLFIAVIKLTLNYLYISGLAEQFGFTSGQVEEEAEETMGLADKFQLVKQVAQTVQNKAGSTSDTLEKLRNLTLWRQPEATRKLYVALLVFLVITLFLPNSYSITLIGLFAGMKLFIVDNIYRKYPRVQEEFDDVDKMWRSLPTDVQLLERQTLSRDEMTSLLTRRSSSLLTNTDGGSIRGGEGGGVSTHTLSEEESGFCSRFDLPTSEVPFPDWQGGRRCTLIDRDRPLMGSRGGRLYLTYSFLCFERFSMRSRDSDRLVLPLSDITVIEKAKPFAVLPGNGMAIEVTLKSSDKYMFGAILNRDGTLASILEQGLMLGLLWGADPDDLSTSNPAPSVATGNTNTNNQNSENISTQQT